MKRVLCISIAINVVCSLVYCATSYADNYQQSLDSALFHSDPTKDPTADEDIVLVAEERQKNTQLRISRTDQIPRDRLKAETAAYLEGYIQAMIDANYYEFRVIVSVDKDKNVMLFNLPNDELLKHSIIAFVSDLPDVGEVREGKIDKEIQTRIDEKEPIRRVKGVWFPESTVLFQPLIANPREPVYSIAYRWGDNVIANQEIAISLGDVFPLFRWFSVFHWRGDLQLDIAACMWANFDMDPEYHPRDEWAELVTSDYLLSIPLSYAVGKWAYRLRVYHISSHLGDEFIVNRTVVNRINVSFEALDFFASYQATDGLRVYLGPGFVLHSDNAYPMKVFYGEYGLEWRFSGLRYHYHRLYGTPFFAVDVQQWQACHYRPSVTAQLGYEWSKLQGAGRKVRLFAEYHNGNSEGQFFKDHTQYIAARLSWGF